MFLFRELTPHFAGVSIALPNCLESLKIKLCLAPRDCMDRLSYLLGLGYKLKSSMLSIENCSEFYPYAGKTSPCGGNVHMLTTKMDDNRIKPTDIKVCDSHMESFKELGQRPKFQFTVIEDSIIGVITPMSSERQRPSQEKK